jgi:hypothetical protein
VITHSQRRLHLPYPAGWIAYLSHREPDRLVVFVHGFNGRAVSTWQRFPESGARSTWWQTSDLLFVGYDSIRDTIVGAATRLRHTLPHFYPRLPSDLTYIGSVAVRPPSTRDYQELILVGHSLGGVVLKRMLCDLAQEWLDQRALDTSAARPPVLSARVRLFSPASAGFRSAGWLGLFQASPLWSAMNMYLRKSSAYTDLQPDSDLLRNTRQRTERLVVDQSFDLQALRASILWANPDNVVLAERYDTDYVDDSVDNTNHSTVCKPTGSYDAPWTFVEKGRIR